MPKIFSIDIQVAMTVYINADSEEEAKAIALGMKDDAIELPTGYVGGDIDGEVTNDMIDYRLPEISFSPTATIQGVFDIETIEEAYDSDEDPDYEPDEDEDEDPEYEGAVEASKAPDRFDD